MRQYKPKSLKQLKQAEAEIKELFKKANSSDKADNYVKKARRIAMKNKIKLSSSLKKRFCKHCYAYLKQGKTVRVRKTEKALTYTCLKCNKQMRFPIKYNSSV